MAPARSRPRWAAPTYGLAAVVFGGVAGGLVAQVQAGEDPALGAVAPATIPQPHYVVTRRVVKTRVVVRRVRDLPPLPTKTPVVAAVGSTAVSSGAVASAPPVSYSAPAAPSSGGGASSGGGSSSSSRAPAVAAAPAPAPAVSAPVTRAS